MNLSISNLTKVYANGVKAVDNLSLDIGAGMFGLLGPNGAGKSTLMRTLATLQKPDAGSIIFAGIDVLRDPMKLRQILGYLPQEFGVYPSVTAEDLLDYLAALKGLASKPERAKMVARALEITNLHHQRKKYVSGFSGGMKQRFGIAQLLLNNPRLIIVDEPTAGLDPAERQRFLNILREIGTHSTVIFSTHIVDDVKDLCLEMAIMKDGRILKQSSPAEFTREINGRIWTMVIARDELETIEAKHDIFSSSYNPDNSLTVRAYAIKSPGSAFTPAEPQLEDAYFIALRMNTAGAASGRDELMN